MEFAHVKIIGKLLFFFVLINMLFESLIKKLASNEHFGGRIQSSCYSATDGMLMID